MKILLVEDNINDAKIIIRILKAEYDDLYAYRIDTEAEYRRELKSNYDIILSDYSMPDFDGMRALKIRNEEYPLMPFIIVTGSVNEMTAVDCLIAGADNYIIKEHQNRLLPAIKKAIQDKNNEKIRIEYEKKLKEINIKYTELVENSDLGILIESSKNELIFANPTFLKIFEYNIDELKKLNYSNLIYADDLDLANQKRANRSSKDLISQDYVLRGVTKNGHIKWLNIYVELIQSEGKINGNRYYIRDISEERKLKLSNDAINQIAKIALTTNDLSEFCKITYEIINTFVQVKNFYVALYDEKENKYTFPFSIDEFDKESDFNSCDYSDGLTDYVRKNKKPVLLNKQDIEKLEKKKEIKVIGSKSKIWLGIPLIHKKNVIGVLGIQDYNNDSAFDKDDLRLFESVATYISMKLFQNNMISELKINELKYRNLFDFSPSPIVVHQNGIFVMANKAAIRMSEAKNEKDLIGKSIFTFILPEMQSIVEDRIDKVIKDKQSAPAIIEKFITLKGNMLFVEVVSIPFEYNGKAAAQVIMKDITEEVKAKKVLEESEEKFRLGFQNTPDAIAVVNSKTGKAIEVNESFVKMTGYSLNKLQISKFPISLFKDFNVSREMTAKLLKQGKLTNLEYEIHDLEGNTHSLLASITVLSKSETPHFMVIAKDISEQKTIQKDLMQAKLKAEESDRLKSAFLANMSHEIRTPMNHIIGFTEFIKQGVTNEELNTYINIIQKSSNHLLELINDIIDISKIEAGQFKMNLEQIRATKVLTEIYENFIFDSKVVSNKNLSVYCESLKLQFYFVLADQLRLKQILYNIIGNAIKYTSEGFIKFGFEDRHDGFLTFYVKDSGIGLSEENQKIIFDRFRQAEGPRGVINEGTGIGLAVTKALVELMNGKIWVESKIDVGSEFYFTIPLVNAKGKNIFTKPKEDFKDKYINNKILVVDDDINNIVLLTAFLHKIVPKVNIIYLQSANNVLDIIEKEKISLVLMDIKMPIISGIEAMKLIKKAYPELPVVAQTAYYMQADEHRLLDQGFDAFIAKPFTKDIVISTVLSFMF